MCKVIMLIGIPASGKSTWRNQYIKENPNTMVLSSDDLIEKLGATKNLTYNEAFKDKEIQKQARFIYKQLKNEAIADNKDIIIDKTNLTKKVRIENLKNIPETYSKHFVVTTTPRDIVDIRNKERYDKTGKFIPDWVINNMEKSFQYPDETEYDTIEEI